MFPAGLSMKVMAIAVLIAPVALTALPVVAAESPCSISGPYVGSAAADAPQGIRQSIFTLTFHPPGDCSPGASGLVDVDAKLLPKGNHDPEFFSVVVPYTVSDDTLTFALPGTVAVEGRLAFGRCDAVADTIVFVAAAASDPPVRFAGVAHSKTRPCP